MRYSLTSVIFILDSPVQSQYVPHFDQCTTGKALQYGVCAYSNVYMMESAVKKTPFSRAEEENAAEPLAKLATQRGIVCNKL
jgi:hypothetical protein